METEITKRGRIRKADVPVIAEIFKELDAREELTPARLVQLAADPESVLHRYFTWDDSAAAQKYRVQEARWLLESIKISITMPGTGEAATINYALSVRGDSEKQDQRKYVLTTRAMKDQYTLRKVVEQAEREARSFVRKYKPYQALRSIVEAMERESEGLAAQLEAEPRA